MGCVDRRASVVIASAGTATADVVQTRYGELRSRSGADLRFTANDAEAVSDRWRAKGGSLPDEFHVLLIDPSLGQVEAAIKDMSMRVAGCRYDVALDLYFAGHGCEVTGDLVLTDGTLSPNRLLDLQRQHIRLDGYPRTIGVFLDSCYSGAFLVHLAVEALDGIGEFRLDEGLASCLPNEECYENPLLEHGVFTYTHLNEGNAYVDRDGFNRAILEDDKEEIAKGLQGLVATMSNASAFLTEGRQFSLALSKSVIDVLGGYASVELDERDDVSRVCRLLTQFKNATP